jgi:hypothetical protein
MEEFRESAILFGSLEKCMCADHIVGRILERIVEGIIDVALRSKMNNRTDLIFVEQM